VAAKTLGAVNIFCDPPSEGWFVTFDMRVDSLENANKFLNRLNTLAPDAGQFVWNSWIGE
jgi:hypothetical protein